MPFVAQQKLAGGAFASIRRWQLFKQYYIEKGPCRNISFKQQHQTTQNQMVMVESGTVKTMQRPEVLVVPRANTSQRGACPRDRALNIIPSRWVSDFFQSEGEFHAHRQIHASGPFIVRAHRGKYGPPPGLPSFVSFGARARKDESRPAGPQSGPPGYGCRPRELAHWSSPERCDF